MNRYQKEERKKKLYQHIIGMIKVMTKNESISGQRNDRQNHEFHFSINLEILSRQKRMDMVSVQWIQILYLSVV